MANGYFEFRNNGSRLEIVLYPPTDEGRMVAIEDIVHCVNKAAVTGFNVTSVNRDLKESGGRGTIVVGNSIIPFGDSFEYKVSDDGMTVVAVHYPGFSDMPKSDALEVYKDLGNIKVKYGVIEEEVKKLLLPDNYFQNIVVAKGMPPKEGKDSVLTYNFEVDKKAKPTIREDGTVDFRNMDNLNHVKAGDVVAQMTPKIDGAPGMDVYGKVIMPAKVKKSFFKYGRNLKPSEDGLRLITQVSGHVSLENDKIFVSNVLEVVNVDNSTGNIDYEGDVVITGNVLAGFSVKAAGSIEVRGIVEGATIESGADLILIRGVQGMNKARITCGGNMVTKFIESAENITVKGDLETDTIFHSKVNVNGYINAQGRNGLIIGGDVKSIHGISAKTIGNGMGTATIVGAGVDPSMKKEIDKLKKDIVDANDNRTKLSQIITALCKKREIEGRLDPDKIGMLQKTTMNIALLDQEMKSLRNRLEELELLVTGDDNAAIKISKTIYPGVKLMFGDVYMYIKTKADYCQYVRKGPDIKMLQI